MWLNPFQFSPSVCFSERTPRWFAGAYISTNCLIEIHRLLFQPCIWDFLSLFNPYLDLVIFISVDKLSKISSIPFYTDVLNLHMKGIKNKKDLINYQNKYSLDEGPSDKSYKKISSGIVLMWAMSERFLLRFFLFSCNLGPYNGTHPFKWERVDQT